MRTGMQTLVQAFLASSVSFSQHSAIELADGFSLCYQHVSLRSPRTPLPHLLQVRMLVLHAAWVLARHGVQLEDAVCVTGDEGLLMVLSQVAVLLAGGCYVPLDLQLPEE
eukprot:675480-Hanusia_phi.AAC.5